MKPIALPIVLLILGLLAASFFFGVDVEGLIKGFLKFLGGILRGPGN